MTIERPIDNSDRREDREFEPLPEVVIPEPVRTLYCEQIQRLAQDTTHYDPTTDEFVLSSDAPHIFISPLRSGPIAKSGYDAYCTKYRIQQPPTLIIPGLGSETRDAFWRLMEEENLDFDSEMWESEEYQKRFQEWIETTSSPAVVEAIRQFRAVVSQIVVKKDEALRLLFVDDAGGRNGDVSNRVTPAILNAALDGKSYRYNYHLMFPTVDPLSDTPWQVAIIKASFGPHLTYEEIEFLYQAIRGSYDEYIPALGSSDDSESEKTGLLTLKTIDDMQLLGNHLQQKNQAFNDCVYPGKIAGNGFEKLFKKYGDNLIKLFEMLIQALIDVGTSIPPPQKT